MGGCLGAAIIGTGAICVGARDPAKPGVLWRFVVRQLLGVVRIWISRMRPDPGSQPGHTFPETGGHGRSPTDTYTAEFEFRRVMADLGGHGRTRDQHGSGQ
jgi:hypothetical protein